MKPCYASLLGVTTRQDEEGRTVCVMPPGTHVEGRVNYLHGGAIAGLLELAAYAAMEQALEDEERAEIKPIGVNIEFMRNGNMVDTYAAGRVLRVGSRIANVTAEAWQDDRQRPIATARMMFSLRR